MYIPTFLAQFMHTLFSHNKMHTLFSRSKLLYLNLASRAEYAHGSNTLKIILYNLRSSTFLLQCTCSPSCYARAGRHNRRQLSDCSGANRQALWKPVGNGHHGRAIAIGRHPTDYWYSWDGIAKTTAPTTSWMWVWLLLQESIGGRFCSFVHCYHLRCSRSVGQFDGNLVTTSSSLSFEVRQMICHRVNNEKAEL